MGELLILEDDINKIWTLKIIDNNKITLSTGEYYLYKIHNSLNLKLKSQISEQLTHFTLDNDNNINLDNFILKSIYKPSYSIINIECIKI